MNSYLCLSPCDWTLLLVWICSHWIGDKREESGGEISFCEGQVDRGQITDQFLPSTSPFPLPRPHLTYVVLVFIAQSWFREKRGDPRKRLWETKTKYFQLKFAYSISEFKNICFSLYFWFENKNKWYPGFIGQIFLLCTLLPSLLSFRKFPCNIFVLSLFRVTGTK